MAFVVLLDVFIALAFAPACSAERVTPATAVPSHGESARALTTTPVADPTATTALPPVWDPTPTPGLPRTAVATARESLAPSPNGVSAPVPAFTFRPTTAPAPVPLPSTTLNTIPTATTPPPPDPERTATARSTSTSRLTGVPTPMTVPVPLANNKAWFCNPLYGNRAPIKGHQEAATMSEGYSTLDSGLGGMAKAAWLLVQ